LWSRNLAHLKIPGSATEHGLNDVQKSEIDFCLQNPEEYIAASSVLQIQKIEIASPGGFTLAGLGEPLREIRELIKDLCYRNRQEREKGDLDILKRKIELVGSRNLSPKQVQVLSMSVIEDTKEVAQLIKEGHLLLEGEKSDSTKIPAQPKKRRRKKPPSTE
jgi:hypothetical protein